MNALIIPERLAQLDDITLDQGSHRYWEDGHCALEVAAWLAGEPHTDRPRCVDLPLRHVVATINDLPKPTERQRLKPYLPRIIGTAGDGHGAERRRILRKARRNRGCWNPEHAGCVLHRDGFDLLDEMLAAGGTP